jgi:glycosyltransferase involved in cell wall biosynthesis
MAARLLKKYKNLQFILPSTGPLLGEVKKIASEAKLPVIFSGFLDTEQDLVEIMQKSDIYVSTSLQEGFGISVCEAMSCELPIVAFDADGVRDVVTPDCGFLTPIGNVDQLVDKVELLIRDKALRRQMGVRSRQRVLKEFTWEKAAEKMQSIYRRTNNR